MDDKSFDEFIKGKALKENILLPSGLNQKMAITFKALPERKKYHNRLFRLSSVAAILAFCVLTSIGFASPSFAANVKNVSNTISSNISNFLGLQKNLDEYQTVINKAVTDQSITVKLNEVILNGSALTVSYSINSNIKLESMESLHALNEIYVNGKRASSGSSGGSRNMDNYTTQEVMTYLLDKVDSNADINIKILCSSILVNGKETKGSWNFEFKTNGSKLLIDTKEILLNYKITLENGGEYTLRKYTDNSLGQEIYASTSDPKKLIYVALRGFDDLGNKVEFTLRHQGEDNALFTLEKYFNGNLNENAKTLTLTPYTSPDGNIYLKVGDQFTIDLSLLK